LRLSDLERLVVRARRCLSCSSTNGDREPTNARTNERATKRRRRTRKTIFRGRKSVFGGRKNVKNPRPKIGDRKSGRQKSSADGSTKDPGRPSLQKLENNGAGVGRAPAARGLAHHRGKTLSIPRSSRTSRRGEVSYRKMSPGTAASCQPTRSKPHGFPSRARPQNAAAFFPST